MVRQNFERVATVAVTSIAVQLILLLSSTGQSVREGYAIASPPPAPSWLLPGDYVEYNQTYTIGGLTASIKVNDTVIGVNGAADMRIQGLGPQVPSGFPEPGLVTPYDSANESQQTTVVTTFANGSRSTSVESGSTFTTDLTMFVDPRLLTGTNATLVPLHVSGSGTPTIQAWRVDENVLNGFVGFRLPEPPNFPVKPSLVWFEKDTLMKVRESTNYTDPNHNYIVSVETMEDTNIPQLKSALTSQESYSSLYSSQESYSSLSSSTTSSAAQAPNDAFEGAALIAAVVVTVTAVASYFARANHRSLGPDPGRA